jgi:hypothetical protein
VILVNVVIFKEKYNNMISLHCNNIIKKYLKMSIDLYVSLLANKGNKLIATYHASNTKWME